MLAAITVAALWLGMGGYQLEESVVLLLLLWMAMVPVLVLLTACVLFTEALRWVSRLIKGKGSHDANADIEVAHGTATTHASTDRVVAHG